MRNDGGSKQPRIASGREANAHLREYLSYYQKLKEPGYAVLITGAWGTGKTFQVKACISESDRYYISLFGVQTTEQLHAEVLAAAFPALGKITSVTEKLKGGIKSLGSRAAALAEVAPNIINSYLRQKLIADRVLIFDDLERSRIDLSNLLGAINFYVERKGFGVIVITHDEKLADGFRGIKEKLFGQEIRIEPQVSEAFDSFVQFSGKSPAQDFIRAYRASILEAFLQSGEKSLRILRHLIMDLGRFHEALSERYLEHPEAMRHVVSLFSALNIEMRSGNLQERDLKDRIGAQVRMLMSMVDKEEEPVPPIMAANEKYPNFNLTDEVLNTEVLIEMLVDGRYDATNIRRSLDNSVYFIKPCEAPPWKVVIKFDDMEDAEVNDAISRMEKQFNNREITVSGEMLHVFSLRLMLAEHGVLNTSLAEETVECKNYINSLLATGRLPPRETSTQWRQDFDRSYDGLGYWVSKTAQPYFDKIWECLIESREQAFKNAAPGIVEGFLAQMATNAAAVRELISPTASGENTYAYIPLLHTISPQRFVDSWLAAPKSQWRSIQYALENRWDSGKLDSQLKTEREWALAVYRILLERAEAQLGLPALRIRRAIPPILSQIALETSHD